MTISRDGGRRAGVARSTQSLAYVNDLSVDATSVSVSFFCFFCCLICSRPLFVSSQLFICLYSILHFSISCRLLSFDAPPFPSRCLYFSLFFSLSRECQVMFRIATTHTSAVNVNINKYLLCFGTVAPLPFPKGGLVHASSRYPTLVLYDQTHLYI